MSRARPHQFHGRNALPGRVSQESAEGCRGLRGVRSAVRAHSSRKPVIRVILNTLGWSGTLSTRQPPERAFVPRTLTPSQPLPTTASHAPRVPRASWASSDSIRRTMTSTRGRDTAPELSLRRAVHGLGLRYRVSTRPLPGVRRTADLVFSRQRVAVYLDGCFWHACPLHFVMPVTNAEFWHAKLRGNVLRDRETDALLEDAGWQSLRVWEHEQSNEAARSIATVVRARLSTLSRGTAAVAFNPS